MLRGAGTPDPSHRSEAVSPPVYGWGRSVPRDGSAKRILIVEDELLLADHVADAVHAMGLSAVGPVGTLEHAIALAEMQQFDGALLDVRLRRGQRIYPVVEILRRRRIPFCFMTAYSEVQIEHMLAKTVLRKPISMAALEKAIQELIDS